jgi:hypothetical protein
MFSFWSQEVRGGAEYPDATWSDRGGGTGVAEITVFIDDAVLGDFPPLCVKEGVPTDDRLTLREPVNRLGPAWLVILVILVGPIGWLCLALLGWRGGDIRATLPFCEFAYRRLKVAQRMQTIWVIFAVIAYLLALTALAIHSRASIAAAVALGLGALGATVKAVLETRRLRYLVVRLQLDGSRRWVTISGVHPAFAAAVAARRASLES